MAQKTKLAGLLAEFERTDDVIVGSFLDHHLRLFKQGAPDVSTAPATAEVATTWATSQQVGPGLTAGHHAFAVPSSLEGVEVVNEDFVADAHANDMAVYVWTINACEEMVRILETGADGIMTDAPSVLHALLEQPAGEWDCRRVTSPAPAPQPHDDDGPPAPSGSPGAEAADAPATGRPLPVTGGGALSGLGALLALGGLTPRPVRRLVSENVRARCSG